MRTIPLFASVLALAVVLALPAPASADHDLTCHPPPPPPGDHAGNVWHYTVYVAPGIVHLGLSVSPEGAVDPHGSVLLEGTPWRAQAAGSSAQCADANGNGDFGLVQAQIALRNVRTGERAIAVVTPEREIDASGLYAGTIDVLGARLEVQIRTVVTWFR